MSSTSLPVLLFGLLSFLSEWFLGLNEVYNSGGNTKALLAIDILSPAIFGDLQTWNITDRLPQFAELAAVNCWPLRIGWFPHGRGVARFAFHLWYEKSG